jgi:nucleoside-triphosphatase THEP1
MAADKRVIICTGPPGSGRDDLLLKMRERTGFNYYHMFEYLVEEARLKGTNLTKLNILDFYDSSPDRMEEFHKAAIEKICAEIEKRRSRNGAASTSSARPTTSSGRATASTASTPTRSRR